MSGTELGDCTTSSDLVPKELPDLAQHQEVSAVANRDDDATRQPLGTERPRWCYQGSGTEHRLCCSQGSNVSVLAHRAFPPMGGTFPPTLLLCPILTCGVSAYAISGASTRYPPRSWS
eukprot:794025-Rhodomonas_salina.2